MELILEKIIQGRNAQKIEWSQSIGWKLWFGKAEETLLKIKDYLKFTFDLFLFLRYSPASF